MLKNRNVVLASAIANASLTKGRHIAALPNTPLAVLGMSLKPMIGEGDDMTAVERAAVDDGTSLMSHSNEMANLANGTINRFQTYRNQIRNYIYPIIREIIEKCEVRRRDVIAQSPININVIQVMLNRVYGNEVLHDMVAPYSGQAYADPGKNYSVISDIRDGLTMDDLVTMTKTSYEGFNEALVQLIAEVAEDQRYNLFEETPLMGMGMYTNHNTLLTYMVLKATTAGQHPRFNVNEATSEQRIYLSRMTGYYGKRLSMLMAEQAKDVARSDFVFQPEANSRVVYVRDQAYRGWLEAGGNMEAVIAYVYNYSRGSNFTASALYNTPDTLKSEYARLARIYDRDARNLTAQEVENLTTDSLVARMVSDHEDTGVRSEKIKVIRDYMSANRMYSNDDYKEYIAKCVCNSVGGNYDAYFIYGEMRDYLTNENNAGKTHEDASVIAAARLLGRWLRRQMVTEACEPRYAVTQTGDSN